MSNLPESVRYDHVDPDFNKPAMIEKCSHEQIEEYLDQNMATQEEFLRDMFGDLSCQYEFIVNLCNTALRHEGLPANSIELRLLRNALEKWFNEKTIAALNAEAE